MLEPHTIKLKRNGIFLDVLRQDQIIGQIKPSTDDPGQYAFNPIVPLETLKAQLNEPDWELISSAIQAMATH